jgi:hypothetical protein
MKLDIEALAREAGIQFDPWWGGGSAGNKQVEAFARLIVERCAVECDSLPAPASCTGVERSLWEVATVAAGDAIRQLLEDK